MQRAYDERTRIDRTELPASSRRPAGRAASASAALAPDHRSLQTQLSTWGAPRYSRTHWPVPSLATAPRLSIPHSSVPRFMRKKPPSPAAGRRHTLPDVCARAFTHTHTHMQHTLPATSQDAPTRYGSESLRRLRWKLFCGLGRLLLGVAAYPSTDSTNLPPVCVCVCACVCGCVCVRARVCV